MNQMGIDIILGVLFYITNGKEKEISSIEPNPPQ